MAVEAIIVGKPLDGTKNPITFVGATFQGDITGVVEYVRIALTAATRAYAPVQTFGFYYLLPLTQ